MLSVLNSRSSIYGSTLGKGVLIVLAGLLQNCASGYKHPQAASNDARIPKVTPMELNTFRLNPAAKAVALHWETVAELGCAFFVVERSIDKVNFTAIGLVPGVEMAVTPTPHEFIDRQPLTTTAYYRLQQIDLNGVVHQGPMRACQAQLDGVSWQELARF